MNFTIKTLPHSGLGDQLGTQFARLYKLGYALGYDYVYSDIYYPRSLKPTWFENFQKINVNIRRWLLSWFGQCLFSNAVNLVLIKIEKRVDEHLFESKDDLSSFFGVKQLGRNNNEKTFYEVPLDKFLEVGNDSLSDLKKLIEEENANNYPIKLIWSDKVNMWQYIPQMDKMIQSVDIDFNKLLKESFAKGKSFDSNGKNLVIHIRCGDSTTVKLNGVNLIVYDKFLYTSEEEMKHIFDIDKDRHSVLPETYLAAYKLLPESDKQNVTVLSDGYDLTYRNIFRDLLKHKCTIRLSKDNIRLLLEKYKTRNDIFKQFTNAKIVIGENEQNLRDSIMAIANADKLIWGCGGFACTMLRLFSQKPDCKIINVKELFDEYCTEK